MGTFGKGVFKQVYPPGLINREWRRIAQVDYYDIYISRKSEKRMVQLMNKTLACYHKASLTRPAIKANVQGTLADPYYH